MPSVTGGILGSVDPDEPQHWDLLRATGIVELLCIAADGIASTRLVLPVDLGGCSAVCLWLLAVAL